jgi:hypothetical protein
LKLAIYTDADSAAGGRLSSVKPAPTVKASAAKSAAVETAAAKASASAAAKPAAVKAPAAKSAGAQTGAAETGEAPVRVRHCAVSGHDVAESIAAVDARRPVEGPAIDASQRTGRESIAARRSAERFAIHSGRSIAARCRMADIGPGRDVWAISDVRSLAAGPGDIEPAGGAGLQRWLTAPAAKIHARLRAAGDVAGAAKPLCDSRIVVSHPLAVDGIVNPTSGVREIHRAIEIDVVGSPVEAAAPAIAAAHPVPERIGPAEGQPGRKQVSADVVRRPEIIGRIVGVGPRAVNDARIVLRHVEHVRLRRLDVDDRLAPFLLGRHGLLLV